MTKHDKKIIIELICNEQTHMMVKNPSAYESERYKTFGRTKGKNKR